MLAARGSSGGCLDLPAQASDLPRSIHSRSLICTLEASFISVNPLVLSIYISLIPVFAFKKMFNKYLDNISIATFFTKLEEAPSF